MSIRAAINTLEASDWTLFKVALFGKKKVVHEADKTVVLRTYKGEDYLMNTIPKTPDGEAT